MPTLRQIEYLAALADARHFRKAAERVGVSQPTLSAQLAALEERLGVQLVERSRSSVLLTQMGERILEVGRRMLLDAKEIHDLAAGARGEFAGALRLGLPPTVAPHLLPLVLPTLHAAHPGFKIYVREQLPRDLPAALADGVYDAILCPTPVIGSDFSVVQVFREPLYVVAPADHAWAGRGALERADLRGEAVLTLERGHQLHDQALEICEEVGAKVIHDYEGTSLETVLQMVALGMGVAFLPGLFVHAELGADGRGRGVVALELKGRALTRTIGMAWRRTSAREPDYRLLLSFLRAAVERERPGFTLL
ncbi:MAG: LysR substrate-binding domain-containing protein [Pseudomonadota bacterium]